MKIQFTLTDTYGGEANFAWVRRGEAVRRSITDRGAVRLAKAWAEWTGRRCTVENYGDSITIRPSGLCQVMFIDFAEEA